MMLQNRHSRHGGKAVLYLALKRAGGRYRSMLAWLATLGTGVWLISHSLVHALAWLMGVPCP
jgi:hypothetical protein